MVKLMGFMSINKELALLSEWWEDLNVAKNIPYGRDRLIETYMWVFGTVFEPQYSNARMLLCKFIAVIAILDDTYDSYGTIDELRLLTDALNRFTPNAANELPQYFKYLYKIILEFAENDEQDTALAKPLLSGKSYTLLTNSNYQIQELAACYLLEATWQKEKEAPSFVEYRKNGKVTSGYDVVASVFLLEVENMSMNEILWMKNDPEIAVGAKLHLRLMNDIDGVLTDEMNREDFPKAVDCYTIQYGVSKAEAIEALQNILENQWKKMNEDLLKPITVPKILLKYTLNYSRTSIFFYQGTDLYTYGHNLKEYLTSFFINPLLM
ncbi:Terpene synthase 5 [Euphorbia peplus]|nr:Terpene synthase 5 [Euphorbia peplus]